MLFGFFLLGSRINYSIIDSHSTTSVLVKEKSHVYPPKPPMSGIMKYTFISSPPGGGFRFNANTDTANSKPTKSIPLGYLVAPTNVEITLLISPGPGSPSHLVTVNKFLIRGSSGRRAAERYPLLVIGSIKVWEEHKEETPVG
ncbi:hypothetical protein HOY80DRAFT_1034620 [Tuber brumale]|nr:hypothetical protein HOY80DRAFT_1034620 [Tuber brumale]